MSPRDTGTVTYTRLEKWWAMGGPVVSALLGIVVYAFLFGQKSQAGVDEIFSIKATAVAQQQQIDSLSVKVDRVLDSQARSETRIEMMYEWMKATRSHNP